MFKKYWIPDQVGNDTTFVMPLKNGIQEIKNNWIPPGIRRA
ncbi:MAG: hypothetical protein WAW31_08430 [Smithella sp.]